VSRILRTFGLAERCPGLAHAVMADKQMRGNAPTTRMRRRISRGMALEWVVEDSDLKCWPSQLVFEDLFHVWEIIRATYGSLPLASASHFIAFSLGLGNLT
jgi:hypothetical protein